VSQERLSVRKIREVLRLHHEAGLSNRAIARVCKVSNSTVGQYLIRAAQAGLEWLPPEGLSEDDLQRLCTLRVCFATARAQARFARMCNNGEGVVFGDLQWLMPLKRLMAACPTLIKRGQAGVLREDRLSQSCRRSIRWRLAPPS